MERNDQAFEMANISEERLKEMEEEMSRFEQEISMPEPRLPGVRPPLRPPVPGSAVLREPMPQASVLPRPPIQFIPHQLRHLRPPPPPPRLPMGGPSFHPGPLVPPPPLPRLAASFLAPPLAPPPALPPLPEQPLAKTAPQVAPASAAAVPVTQAPVALAAATHNVIVAAPAVYAAAPVRKVVQPLVPLLTEKAEPAPRETKSKSKAASHKSGEKQKASEKSSEKSAKPSERQPAPATTDDGSAPKKKKKERKVIRTAGQQIWEDSSLHEWDTDDFRIFCGDLGNDVTDEVLIRVFSKFPSFLKAKVIRDKRTNKSKGYGFVSFKDPQDFIRAMREINGKYVGSRPIKLRKSCWRDRNIEAVRKKTKEKERLGLL